MDQRRPSSVRLTERDRELLSFVAEHRLVLPSHVASLLDTSPRSASTRLRALAREGYLSYQRVFAEEPACCQIRRKGLAAIGSTLPSPRLDLACYRHDVGAAWLWLAARAGTFGPVRHVLGERRLRSSDGALDRPREPYGVRLGGVGPRGHERLHYPDLLLITGDGARIALELELSSKGRTRREKILSGYASDDRIGGVLYLVEDRAAGRAIGRSIQNSAGRLGISSLVRVDRVRLTVSLPGSELGPGSERGSAAGRRRGTDALSAPEVTR